jgi:hypothetical protein
MNNIKRFSDLIIEAKKNSGKMLKHNSEEGWDELGSEFALRVPIKVVKLTSEGIQHFHRKKETRVTVTCPMNS